MEKIIKSAANDLGFCLVGITSAEPVRHVKYLEDAVDLGRIASMHWLARDSGKRCDPASLLAGAKSVICCALKFGEEGIDNKNGVVDKLRARFARGRDYHVAIREGLEKLQKLILAERPDARTKVCVDTSPVLEKALAARAGLGTIGKNTILINDEIGSWFMLGTIIADIELKPDAPAKNLCGECTRCIDACPTGALIAPCKLDARKCISYLTIEVKDNSLEKGNTPVPEGAYGCDICQDACPLNQHPQS